MRLQLLIAYEGSGFAGWQSQSHGNAVQDLLETALEQTCGSPIRVHAAGRTDAGVHAYGQSVHFDIPEGCLIPLEAWRPAINQRLPARIRVMEVLPRPDTFHARFDVVAKTYRYQICCSDPLPPFEAGRAWHFPKRLSAELLEAEIRRFQGRHNFRAFHAREPGPVRGSIRTVSCIAFEQTVDGFQIEITADGFLYKMVRIMVGAAVRVAEGKLPAGFIAERLENPHLDRCTFVAPADGLFLLRVDYPE